MFALNRACLYLAYTLLLKGIGYFVPFLTTPWGIGSLLLPAIGFFVSPLSCVYLYVFRSMYDIALYSHAGIYLTYLPTLSGSLILSSNFKAFKIGIPAVCIFLFIVHPVGGESWLYCTYWIIPLAIACLSKPGFFLKSVASTFTTHAVGSVIYVYTHSTTSIFWHTLIMRVWYERLLYALILTLSYHLICVVIKLLVTLRAEGKVCQSQLPCL